MVRNFGFFCLFTVLLSCGDSGNSSDVVKDGDLKPATSFFQFRAYVQGLEGRLILANNDANDILIEKNGMVTFPEVWTNRGNYEIRVIEEPCAQRCVVDQPKGKISTTGFLTLTISCSPKTWEFPLQESQAVSLPNTQAKSPMMAMNKYGDMLLTWYQTDFYNWQGFKKVYQNREWKNPTSVTDHYTFPGSDVAHQSVDINDYDEASIAWTQNIVTGKKIFIGDYKDSTWTFPSNTIEHLNVSSYPSGGYPPVVKINHLGEKILVWGQLAGTNVRLYKAEYKNGTWDVPFNIIQNVSPDGTDVSWMDAAMNDVGDIVVVWQQSDGTHDQIYKSEYRSGIWSHPLSLADSISVHGSNAREPKVAINNKGETYIVWFQYDNTSTNRYQVFVSEYKMGGWIHPVSLSKNISPNGKHSKFPKVVLNDDGKVQIVSTYRPDETVDEYQVVVQKKNTSGWSNPMRLTTTAATKSPSRPSIGMDEQGNTVVAWALQDTGQVYKAEYRNGSWLLASLLDPINFNTAIYDSPQVAVNNCRSALAWQQNNNVDVGQIYLAQYR